MLTKIETTEDVKAFVKELVAEGLNYHPDDDFTGYINISTEEASYTADEAALRNKLNNQCFEVCERERADIYDISMEIFLIETGMDKFIPLPSQVS
jgi:hypothetical protein